MKTIPYGHQSIDKKDIQEVVNTLKSDWLTQGPKIKEFEGALCKYTGAKYAVAVSSGTAALHLACLAAEIKHYHEVITSPLTFVASANCVLYCGGRPVFADIELESGNINPQEIAKKITARTKVIIPVHFAGRPCDLIAIRSLVKKKGLMIIEDAAHALGASYRGKKIGACAYSDMTIFSFHAIKSITTGEGGAVLTNKLDLFEKLNMLRNHGITKKKFIRKPDGEWYYEMQTLGYNFRITDLQAALGLSQLKKLKQFIQQRRKIARIYHAAFRGNPWFDLPGEKKGYLSAHHLYSIRLKDTFKQKKKQIFLKLRERGLGVQVHYIPVYLQPYYRKLGFRKGICPKAEEFYEKEISIPLYPSMDRKAISCVIKTILRTFAELC
jgi:UDP-4-amino-4,6-dideoxy-N-acetyl-beta-L-altrosamine transaminase